VEAHGPAEALKWLQRGLPGEGATLARGLFFGFYAGAGRRFGGVPLGLQEQELERLRAAGVADPQAWSLPDLVRAALLLCAIDVTDRAEHVGLAREAYQKGDNGERIALLRTLALLPEPERFVDVGVEACRSHVQDVFEAIACDNPYPAAHFPELHFNQMVMKALFTEAPLSRVLGWHARVGPELRRMASDYRDERRAAGRPVPQDVGLILGEDEEKPTQ
jgi:hypothetical protein